jgi:glyoxylase-like metal-dependent hydrolase (beta-lactamase superfamily II)
VHFWLEELAEGVYAAIHVAGGAAIGNAGIVDLGGRTLVYDTFFTPQAGEDLRIAAQAVTGRAVDWVVNSHYHNDHIWGNQAFDGGTTIVATEETRRLIVETRGHDDFDTFMENAEVSLESTLAQFEATEDEGERRQVAFWVDYHRAQVEAKPILEVRAPDLAFADRMAFHGRERSAELIAYDKGHCPSDAVLFLPEEGIVFMGDLLFVDHHPWLGAGDPDCFRQILREVAELKPRMVVPGHGPVGGPESLEHMSQYVDELDGLARSMLKTGDVEKRIDAMAVPQAWEEWGLAAFFTLNLRFLCELRAVEVPP